MNVVGVDPGKKSPYHCAVPLGSVLGVAPGAHGSVPVSGGIGAAFVEGQFPNAKASRQGLMTLSFYAGIQIGAYMERGIDCYVLMPRAWKPLLVPGGGTMPKKVFQNRLRKLIPDAIWKAGADGEKGEDATDAYCIAIVGSMLLAKRSKLLKRLEWHK